MRRLIKLSEDIGDTYLKMLNNLGKDGRELIKNIENYKYKINQGISMINDEKISKKLDDCVDDLNNVSAFIYSFVFDLENYEITDDYSKQIEFSAPKEEEPIDENEKEVDDEEIPDNNKEDNNQENVDEEDENKDDMDDDFDLDDEEDFNDDSFDEDDTNDAFDKANENDESLE